MTIQLHLQICPATGKPYVWGNATGARIYIDISTYVLPERFRKWCQARGRQFHAYIESFDTTNDSMDPVSFLHSFPSWEHVRASLGDDNEWTEDDHNEFKAAVEYMAERPGYMLVWSY